MRPREKSTVKNWVRKKMSDEIRAENTPEVSQVEPMPSSEQTESSNSSKEVVDVANASPVTESVKEQDFELPEEVSRRTREQFNKLRSQLDYYKQAAAKSNDIPLYDLDTGLINPTGLDKLSATAIEANERALKAERSLNSYLDSLQEKEAYAEFPNLNPNSRSFDKSLHKAVRSLIVDSMVNPMDYDGKELTMAEAAREITKLSSKKIDEVKKDLSKEIMSELTPKEEASLEARGKSDRRPDDSDSIRERSRQGDRLAVIERLKRLSSN